MRLGAHPGNAVKANTAELLTPALPATECRQFEFSSAYYAQGSGDQEFLSFVTPIVRKFTSQVFEFRVVPSIFM